MNLVYGVSTFIFQDTVALWNFTKTLTDLLLVLSQPRVAFLWTLFFKFVFTYREIVLKLRSNIGHELRQTTGKMPQWQNQDRAGSYMQINMD